MEDKLLVAWGHEGSSNGSHDSQGCQTEMTEIESSNLINGKAPKRAQCQVPGCATDLLEEGKPYCIKKRLCADHMRADAVLRRGYGEQQWRFCFQCGKLEPLSLFDGSKRSCRSRLQKRRQPPRRSTTCSDLHSSCSAAQHHHLSPAAAAAAAAAEYGGDLMDDVNHQHQRLQADLTLQEYLHPAMMLRKQMQQQLMHLQQQRQLLKDLRAELRAAYAARPEAMVAASRPSSGDVMHGVAAVGRVYRRAPRKAVSMLAYGSRSETSPPAAAVAAASLFTPAVAAASQGYVGDACCELPSMAAAAAVEVCRPMRLMNSVTGNSSGGAFPATATAAASGAGQFSAYAPLQPVTPDPLSETAPAAYIDNAAWEAACAAAAASGTQVPPATAVAPAAATVAAEYSDIWTQVGNCQQAATGGPTLVHRVHHPPNHVLGTTTGGAAAAAAAATAAVASGGSSATHGTISDRHVDHHDLSFEDLLRQIPDDDLMGELDQMINLGLDDLGLSDRATAATASSALDSTLMQATFHKQQNMQHNRLCMQNGAMNGMQYPAAAAVQHMAVQPNACPAQQQQQLLQPASLMTAATANQPATAATAALGPNAPHVISGHSVTELQQQVNSLQQVVAQARSLIDSAKVMQPHDVAAVTQYVKGQVNAAIQGIHQQHGLQ